MTQPFLGMIATFGFNFDPPGWEFCRGQLLQISEYDTLYALIGTTYGGDGITTFGIPDLRGRVPVGQGAGPGRTYFLGELQGSEQVTITTQQLPSHNHPVVATTEAGDTSVPTGAYPANTFVIDKEYNAGPANLKAMHQQMVSAAGTNPAPFSIVQPVLAVNYCIAVNGIWPNRP